MYLPVKWSLVGHISGGMLALLIGPLQFWKGFRARHLTTHRWLGSVYLMAILIGSLAATHMTWTVALAIHWTWAMALHGLAFAWIVTAGMAYLSVRRRRINEHKEWMIRSYVVTFAFVSFRWIENLPFVSQLGSFSETAPTLIWISWAIPLLIAEVFISWSRPVPKKMGKPIARNRQYHQTNLKMKPMHKFFLLLFSVTVLSASGVFSQDQGSQKLSYKSGDPKDWPKEQDAVAAAPDNHKVLMENDRVRVLEVTLSPRNYPSVIILNPAFLAATDHTRLRAGT